MNSEIELSIYVPDFGTADVKVDEICPHCHKQVVYHHIQSTKYRLKDSTFAAVFTCPNCKEYILNGFFLIQ